MSRPNASFPLWTTVAGVVIQAESLSEMAVKLGISYPMLYSGNHRRDGRTWFIAGKRTFNLGYETPPPKPERGLQKAERAEGGPLLRGLVTHRLGVYRGERC